MKLETTYQIYYFQGPFINSDIPPNLWWALHYPGLHDPSQNDKISLSRQAYLGPLRARQFQNPLLRQRIKPPLHRPIWIIHHLLVSHNSMPCLTQGQLLRPQLSSASFHDNHMHFLHFYDQIREIPVQVSSPLLLNADKHHFPVGCSRSCYAPCVVYDLFRRLLCVFDGFCFCGNDMAHCVYLHVQFWSGFGSQMWQIRLVGFFFNCYLRASYTACVVVCGHAATPWPGKVGRECCSEVLGEAKGPNGGEWDSAESRQYYDYLNKTTGVFCVCS